MKRKGLLVLLAAVLTGCGAGTNDTGEGSERGLEPGPPIRAVDRPAPRAFTAHSQPIVGYKTWCVGSECAAEEPTEESLDRAREETRRWIELVSPAPGTEPRAVAELSLGGERVAELVTWRTEAGKLCALTRIVPREASLWDSQLTGDCEPALGCESPCLVTAASMAGQLVLAGIVDREADAFRLTSPHNQATFPLVGPAITGSDLRVFMLELGTDDWRRLEFLRDGEMLEEDELLHDQLRTARCSLSSGDDGQQAPTEVELREMDACLEAAFGGVTDSVETEEQAAEDCAKRFDESEAGFQTCVEEGEGEPSE